MLILGREAAEEFAVSASTAVIWVKCFRQTGRCAAKPRGGSISPLEKHADILLGLIEKQPDLTLDEVVLAMRKHVTRLLSKKSLRAAEQERADVARARRRWIGTCGVTDWSMVIIHRKTTEPANWGGTRSRLLEDPVLVGGA